MIVIELELDSIPLHGGGYGDVRSKEREGFTFWGWGTGVRVERGVRLTA